MPHQPLDPLRAHLLFEAAAAYRSAWSEYFASSYCSTFSSASARSLVTVMPAHVEDG